MLSAIKCRRGEGITLFSHSIHISQQSSQNPIAMAAIKRNWADLPQELLQLIARKFPDISDLICTGAVCKPWRFSLSVSDLPPLQFPRILKLSTGPDLEFYSISSNKVYRVHAPNSSGEVFGSASGYLLSPPSGNKDYFSLLNPLTSNEVHLPDLGGTNLVGPQSFQRDDFLVVKQYDFYGFRLLVCKPGDNNWDGDNNRDCIGWDRYWDRDRRHFYLKGLLLTVDSDNSTKFMDLGSHKESYVVPPPEEKEIWDFSCNKTVHIVESYGEILRVCCYYYHVREYYEFDIYRLELGNEEGHPCWVRVSSIGDQMLFFDFASDCGFCLRPNSFDGFKGNCIYFIHTARRTPDLSRVSNGLNSFYAISMYDIENGRTVSIDCPFDYESAITWFVPTLKHI